MGACSVGGPSGLRFSLSLVEGGRLFSLLAPRKLMKDLGRESKPARLEEDFLDFGGFVGDGSREAAARSEPHLLPMDLRLGKADLVGDLVGDLDRPCPSSLDFIGERSCWLRWISPRATGAALPRFPIAIFCLDQNLSLAVGCRSMSCSVAIRVCRLWRAMQKWPSCTLEGQAVLIASREQQDSNTTMLH